MKLAVQPYRAHAPLLTPLAGDGSFVRGFVAGACLSAFQDRPSQLSRADLRRVLRHALQGGTALVAGSQAAAALYRHDYARALVAGAAGAAGVLLIERLLCDAAQAGKENDNG